MRDHPFRRKRRALLRTMAASCLLLASGGAPYAQSPGAKHVTIVVPYTPGSGGDTIARVLAEPLREKLNQVVVVENRVGASGNIGTFSVAKSQPDGHTLLLAANTIVLNVGLFKDPGYDPLASFAPVMVVATGHMALATKPTLSANSVQDLVALAKADPGKINYASPGRGTPHHLAMELLKGSAGVQMVHVPYSGLAKSMTDLVGGHVDTMFVGLHSVMPLAKDGKAKILGVGSRQRVPSAAQIPTIAEQGLPGFEVEVWFGLLAPVGTPPDMIARINAAMNEVLKQPEVIAALDKQGLTLVGGSPERLSGLLADDLKTWLKVIKDAGIATE
jgi:tripartite-type tricarboxylate transporter receptor subunit TctC